MHRRLLCPALPAVLAASAGTLAATSQPAPPPVSKSAKPGGAKADSAKGASSGKAGEAKAQKPPESPLAKAAAALPFRSLGPGLMSGRIQDIAVNPTAP